MWTICGEHSMYCQWLQHFNSERLQKKTWQGMFEYPLGLVREIMCKSDWKKCMNIRLRQVCKVIL